MTVELNKEKDVGYSIVDGEDVTNGSNTVDLTQTSRGIIVTVGGNVTVTLYSGTKLVLPSLVAGIIHPIQATRIWATGTTATGIRAVW